MYTCIHTHEYVYIHNTDKLSYINDFQQVASYFCFFEIFPIVADAKSVCC